MKETLAVCPCGSKPLIEGDEITRAVIVECRCGRMVGGKNAPEAIRMWNAAIATFRTVRADG